MKILRTKKWMFAIFIPAFLLGILYVNVMIGRHLTDYSIFSEYFLKQYASVDVSVPEYMMYLTGIRLFPFLCLQDYRFRFRKAAAGTSWCGRAFVEVLLTMGAFSMGIKGVLLCMVALLPHFLFYIPAYVVLLWYAMTAPHNRWNRQKTIFVLLMLGMGIVSEGYVDGVDENILKNIVKILEISEGISFSVF